MSKKHDEFIAAFKRIEQNIKKLPNVTPDANFKWLEDQMNDQTLITKMRMCRLLRNYIQHEPDYESFITINDGMFFSAISIFSDFTRLRKRSINLKTVLTPISADISKSSNSSK